ncbi:MAG: DUF348 domain-containing protein [Propionibacteriales bacterium]|nr:DUF348 domain-containing protein [Propionibacteriales bacterium]
MAWPLSSRDCWLRVSTQENSLRRRIVIVAVAAVAILGLLGGTLTYASLNKTVTLSIDGKVTEVSTFASSVEDVLAEEGIEIGERDAVAPSLSASIDEGSRIAVRFARKLTLTVDGEDSNYWVTATNVSEALAQIGMRFVNAELSTSRGADIGRSGLDVEVRTQKKIIVIKRGKKHRTTTTAVTVREALRELGIKYDGNDEIAPALRASVEDGTRIELVRINRVVRSVKVSVSPKTIVRQNDAMYEDRKKVRRAGRDGLRQVTYRIVFADGDERRRKVIATKMLRAPVPRIEIHGTKERPEPEAPTGDTSVWYQLAECESGGDWSINTGNGYYGGLQFNLSTWQAYGGTGYPHEHPASVQIAIAEKLRDANGGYGAWPACAAELGLPT